MSKISINAAIKPVISGKNIFLVTNRNLLVCINLETGEIIYSVDINQNISEFLNTKKKSLSIKTLAIVNNDLYLFLNNSYFVKFISNGKIKSIVKLSSPPQSLPIFINESILYLNYKNKLIINN
jgi:outer membrane protein assembly factor BamB